MKITREVIADLWPVYAAGEANADTCVLIEEFMRQDPEFARLLNEKKAEDLLRIPAPPLPNDHEVKALNRVKKQLFGPVWIFFLAMLFSCMAFGRIVSDTSWDVSPKAFIATAAIAVVFWVAFFIRLVLLQQKVLSKRERPSQAG
jgi:hypothetical protein